MNKLVRTETQELKADTTISYAIFINLNMDSLITYNFLIEVKEAFIAQRMISPPETALLLITILGNINAQDFAFALKKVLVEDKVAKAFIHRMAKADVIQGTEIGEILSSASLL